MSRLDQIAYLINNDEDARKLKEQLGLSHEEWIEDIVTADNRIRSADGSKYVECRNRARLQFNYSLGIELEILKFLDQGPSWHANNPLRHQPIFTSHSGFHLTDDEEFPVMDGYPLVQETWTLSHTSKYLTDKDSPGYLRRYHYRIHQLAPGTYAKFIKRVHPQ